MNFDRLDKQLRRSLGDNCGDGYDEQLRFGAIATALREYSRFVPLLRRMGTGVLSDATAAGAIELLVTGGPFAVGDIVKIGLGASMETRTISAVAPDQTSGNEVGSGTIITVAALTFAHRQGEFITRATVGLLLVAGVDTYELPSDFIGPDLDSLDLAIGSRATIKKGNGFFDAAYTNSNNYSGPMPNPRPNYGGATVNYSNPNMGVFGPSGMETLYRFTMAGTPILTISPAPAASRTLDIYYQAQQTVDTVHDSDLDAVLHLCKAEAVSARATTLGELGSWSEGSVKENNSAGASSLMEIATQERAIFDKHFRFRPVLMGG